MGQGDGLWEVLRLVLTAQELNLFVAGIYCVKSIDQVPDFWLKSRAEVCRDFPVGDQGKHLFAGCIDLYPLLLFLSSSPIPSPSFFKNVKTFFTLEGYLKSKN